MNWNDAAEDFLNQVLAQTPRPARDETLRADLPRQMERFGLDPEEYRHLLGE
jgi:hypothetical protein